MKRYRYVNENELVNDMTKLVKKMQKNYGMRATGVVLLFVNFISILV